MTTPKKITIYRDDAFAGSGTLRTTDHGPVIDDCPAILGESEDSSDTTYLRIEDAIASGRDSVTRPDGVYTWGIE